MTSAAASRTVLKGEEEQFKVDMLTNALSVEGREKSRWSSQTLAVNCPNTSRGSTPIGPLHDANDPVFIESTLAHDSTSWPWASALPRSQLSRTINNVVLRRLSNWQFCQLFSCFRGVTFL